MRKPAPIPNIDLGATFAVIDTSGAKPVWKKLGRNFATDKHAQEYITQYNLPGVWILDDCGTKRYVTRHKSH